jgi:protein phosphatase
MRALIVSDLHGNLEAIQALPRDYDELWVLGDLVNYGPNPREAIDFVRANASLVVRGNHDHAVGWDVDPQCSARFRSMAEEMRRFTALAVTEADREFLRALPVRVERRLGDVRFLACHATPGDPLYRYLGPGSPSWEEELRRRPVDVLLVGHTHRPFRDSWDAGMVVNPGSVGQPKNGVPKACYAIWTDGQVRLESVEYDFEETIAKIRSLPVAEVVKEELALVLRAGSAVALP